MSCILGVTPTTLTFSSLVLKYSFSLPASSILYQRISTAFSVWPLETALYRYGVEASVSLVKTIGSCTRVPVSLPVLASVGILTAWSNATTSTLPSRPETVTEPLMSAPPSSLIHMYAGIAICLLLLLK
ncbi:hypothetical protein D3C86_1597810 [compost metagenome]